MALTVETGAGLAGADSYLSVADADTYHTAHGDPTTWSGIGTDAEKEEALRLATQYLDLVYAGKWRGAKGSSTQALAWPRIQAETDEGYIFSSTALPLLLEHATAALALLHVTETAAGSSLLPDQSTPAAIGREKVAVGSIEIDTTFLGGSEPYKKYSLVDLMVRALTQTGNTIERA